MASSTAAPTASSGPAFEPAETNRTALIIDGSYAMIGARSLGGKIDYIKLRGTLEEQASTQFGDCWFFDQNPAAQRLNATLTAEYHMLKFAPPDGPQFQVSLFPMKKYSCHCRKCGNNFTQNVQKGVDNGIATKILSLAYENICDRFILFAGDGDFYSSLSHVRNVLRKDIWVIGYRGTVSGDLQQLASRVIYMNDLWSQVQSNRHARSLEQGHRDEGRREDRPREERRQDEGRREERRLVEGRRQEVRWFEDHEGEDFQNNNNASSPLEDADDVGSSRQVVIAPTEEETSHSSSHLVRRRTRSREKRRGRDRNGRGRSRSRSKDRPRAEPLNDEAAIASSAAPDAEDSASVSVGVAKKKKKSMTEGKQGSAVKNGKKRKRNEGKERGRSKRRSRSDRPPNNEVIVTLSDVSDEDNGDKPFPLPLPVPRKPTAATPVITVDEVNSRTQIIDLSSDTESE